MKLSKFRLRDFLWFFSVQVGVVFYCCVGLVIHTTSILKVCFNFNTETDPKTANAQYAIVVIFLVFGLAIYICGLVGAALQGQKTLKVTGWLLVIEFIFWFALMIVSFVETCNIVACIDNRCPERLYIQNGYWRKTRQECEKLNNHADSRTNDTDSAGYDDYEEYSSGNSTSLRELSHDNSSSPEKLPHDDSAPQKVVDSGNSSDRTGDDTHLGNETWTPIGSVGTNPHYGLSVAYAVLLTLLWYLYSILLIFSLAIQIEVGEEL